MTGHPTLLPSTARTTFRAWLGCSLLLWAARLPLAWAASRPLALVVGVGDGDDRLLFEPGALFLLEVLRLRVDLLARAIAPTLLLLIGSWVLLLAVTSSILAWLARIQGAPAPRLPSLRQRAQRVAVLAGGAGAATVALGAVTATLLGATATAVQDVTEPTRDVLLLGVLGASLLPFAALGALFDLARIHVLASGDDALGALRHAWATFTARLGRLVVARAAIAAASLAVVAGAGAFVATQPVTSPETGPLVVVVIVHRAAGLLLAALQVAWFVVLVRSARAPQA